MFDRLPSEINSMIFTKVPTRDLLTLKTVNRIGRIMAIEELFNNRRGKDACEAQTELLNSWILERADILKNIRENPFERKKWVEILSACLKDEASHYFHQLACMVFLGEIIGSPFIEEEGEPIGKTFREFLIETDLRPAAHLALYPIFDKDQQSLLIERVTNIFLNLNLIVTISGPGSEIPIETADLLLALAQILPKLSNDHRSIVLPILKSHQHACVQVAYSISQVLSRQITIEVLVSKLFSANMPFPAYSHLICWVVDHASPTAQDIILERLQQTTECTEEQWTIQQKFEIINQLTPLLSQEKLEKLTQKLVDYINNKKALFHQIGPLHSHEVQFFIPCLSRIIRYLNDQHRMQLLSQINAYNEGFLADTPEDQLSKAIRNHILLNLTDCPDKALLNDDLICTRMIFQKEVGQINKQRMISSFRELSFSNNGINLIAFTKMAVALSHFIQELEPAAQMKAVKILLIAGENLEAMINIRDPYQIELLTRGFLATLSCHSFMDKNQLKQFTVSMKKTFNMMHLDIMRLMIHLRTLSAVTPQLVKNIKNIKSDQHWVHSIKFALKHAEIFGIPVKNEGNTSTMNNKAF